MKLTHDFFNGDTAAIRRWKDSVESNGEPLWPHYGTDTTWVGDKARHAS